MSSPRSSLSLCSSSILHSTIANHPPLPTPFCSSLRSSPGSSQNIFAFGGGRKQAERIVPDGNLKVAVPLTCFADVHRVVLRKNECFSSPFLKMLLEQQVEDEGSSMHVLHVEFPNHKLLKGFIIALDEMKDELRGGVGGGNVQLEVRRRRAMPGICRDLD